MYQFFNDFMNDKNTFIVTILFSTIIILATIGYFIFVLELKRAVAEEVAKSLGVREKINKKLNEVQ